MTIDVWTLGIQAVNVLLLVFLLQHVFWKPVAGIIAQRQADAKAVIEDLRQKQAAADLALGSIAHTRAGFAREREAVIAQAQREAEAVRQTTLAKAQAEVEAIRAAAAAALARQADGARVARNAEAARLAVAIARRLAARLEGEAVQAAFRDGLVAEVAAMAPALRAPTGSSTQARITLISACQTDPAIRQTIIDSLTDALGAPCDIEERVDPALIGGFELEGPHFILRNSWKADLDRIAGELAHDG